MKILLQTLVFFLLVTQIVFGQGSWTKIGDMPEIRYAHTADEINGKVYIAGGVNTEQGVYPTTMLVYDKAVSSWSTIPLPGNSLRGQHTSCVVDHIVTAFNLYLIGGGILVGGTVNSTAHVDIYNITSGQWFSINPMPTDRLALACALLDGKIYVAGGLHCVNNVPDYNGLKTFEVYDLASETWSTLPDMPTNRWGLSMEAFDGKIYVFGGRGLVNRPASVDVYDPQDSSWTSVTNIPTPRYQLATCMIDSNIYAIDGWYSSSSGPIYDTVEVYNPITDVWTAGTPMPVAVAMIDGYALNGKIYMYGGTYTTHPCIGTSDMWEFTPPIVPVELTSFTAQSENQKVILKWTTATELNNNGFEIQRKVTESDFATVGFVKGEGTTTNQKEYSYIDKELTDGKYFYRLKQIDFNGAYEYTNAIEVDVRSLDEFTLEQNYPNPFNPATTIGYVLKEKCNAKLTLLNAIGEEVAVLINEEQDKGFHKVDFSSSNLPSGVYFYQLKAGDFISVKKMILLR